MGPAGGRSGRKPDGQGCLSILDPQVMLASGAASGPPLFVAAAGQAGRRAQELVDCGHDHRAFAHPEATRLTEPARTSPTAKTPGLVVA